jgi:hypothetical protein
MHKGAMDYMKGIKQGSKRYKSAPANKAMEQPELQNMRAAGKHGPVPGTPPKKK